MNYPAREKTEKINRNAIELALLTFVSIAYLLTNVLVVGGSQFIIQLNNHIGNFLAVFVTVLSVIIWFRFFRRARGNFLWGGLALGWATWSIAEIYWTLASLNGTEIPYPSLADLFWMLGYIPIYFALSLRNRSLPWITGSIQKALLWSISLLIVGFSLLYIIVPILKTNDGLHFIENLLNFLYPFVDLILVILALRIAFILQKGVYGKAWLWLGTGFIVHSISNLVFTYTFMMDYYYPDNSANLVSTVFVDFFYNMGYLFWVVGTYKILRIHQVYKPINENSKISILQPANVHINIFTKKDNSVLLASQNFARVFKEENPDGKPLHQVLGISEEESKLISEALITRRLLKDHYLIVPTFFGNTPARISGIAVTDPQGNFTGALILIRMTLLDNSIDTALSDYQRGITRSILEKTGGRENNEEEIKEFLAAYHMSFLKAIYNRAIEEGGAVMGDLMIAEFRNEIERKGWQARVTTQDLVDTSNLEIDDIRCLFPKLIERAKNVLVTLMDMRSIDQLIGEVNSSFSKEIQNGLATFNR